MALGLCAPFTAVAQGAYPTKPVRLVVTTGPGTAPDVLGRVLTRKLGELWGAQVVVENRPGAAGAIAAETAARAEPDGYTLFLGTTSEMSVNPHLYKDLRYDPQKDFAPVAEVGWVDIALVVNPDHTPANSLAQFIEQAKSKKEIFFATFGVGTPGHLGAGIFASFTGVKVDSVHFRSVSEALVSLVSGDAQAVFASIPLAASMTKAGKLRAIAATGPVRSPMLPAVPTAREQGFPQFEFGGRFGVYAPAKTPAALLDKLNADIVRALNSPDGKKSIEDAGFRITGGSREELARAVVDESVRWGRTVRAMGIKPE